MSCIALIQSGFLVATIENFPEYRLRKRAVGAVLEGAQTHSPRFSGAKPNTNGRRTGIHASRTPTLARRIVVTRSESARCGQAFEARDAQAGRITGRAPVDAPRK
jgi:hypothetical protein